MKRTALLLGACLLFSATAVRAAEPEILPPPKGAATTPADVGMARPAVEAAPEMAGDCAPENCSAGKWTQNRHERNQSMKECAHSLWNWLTWRPYVCRGPGCCCLKCDACCPPPYTFYFSQCGYPQFHIPWHDYIGQDLPPRDTCPNAQRGCYNCGYSASSGH